MTNGQKIHVSSSVSRMNVCDRCLYSSGSQLVLPWDPHFPMVIKL